MGAAEIVTSEQAKPLSVNEQKRLEQLEGVVVANFKSFVQVGQALAEIRDRQLYRDRALTFESYVKRIFDIGVRRAYQLIDAAAVVENVNNCAQKDGCIDLVPMNEAQARPLARLRPEQQFVVWQAAVEASRNGRVTAGNVNKVVKKYLGEEVTTSIRNAQARLTHEHVSADFKMAFDALMEQILKEKEAGYKATPKAVITKYVKSLLSVLTEGEAATEQAE